MESYVHAIYGLDWIGLDWIGLRQVQIHVSLIAIFSVIYRLLPISVSVRCVLIYLLITWIGSFPRMNYQ